MPILELAADCLIDPSKRWVARNYIASIMLWPDDQKCQELQEEKRETWRAHAYFERLGQAPSNALVEANYVARLHNLSRRYPLIEFALMPEYE